MIISIALFFSACKEIGPDINLHGNQNSVSDTSYIESPVQSPETKNALVEEFTGVQCPNCPQGHQIVAQIQSQYPGRVAAIAYHPINSLGRPFTFSTQDLQNQQSQDVFDYLGQIGQEPAGDVDRQLFTGQSNILLDKSLWNGFTTNELALTTPVNIVLADSYDSASRQLSVVVTLHYNSANTDTTANRLTIALVENNIISAQLNGNVIDTFYVHNNVLRTTLTADEGDLINYPRQAGRVDILVYQATLNSKWVAANMSVNAFVHEFENSKVVYQVKQVSVE